VNSSSCTLQGECTGHAIRADCPSEPRQFSAAFTTSTGLNPSLHERVVGNLADAVSAEHTDFDPLISGLCRPRAERQSYLPTWRRLPEVLFIGNWLLLR
jgi:hypothetical protein